MPGADLGDVAGPTGFLAQPRQGHRDAVLAKIAADSDRARTIELQAVRGRQNLFGKVFLKRWDAVAKGFA